MRHWITAFLALGLIVGATLMLERARDGLQIETLRIGTTPATLHAASDADGPVVVVAHGFAGSRPMMQGYALPLAQAGYRVLSFDFEGHGRNPVPMSGDVSAIDGTTALLVAETRRVIERAREVAEGAGLALLGHSMATDIIIRAAEDERAAGDPVDAIVAISMFSAAVTQTFPRRLIVITGAGEPRLRKAGLAALRLVEPGAREGMTVGDGGILRRAVVAPGVEHVGVLFSRTGIAEARAWLDATFGRATDTAPIPAYGAFVLALLGGIVLAFRPLAATVSGRGIRTAAERPALTRRRYLLAVLVPALGVPLLATWFETGVLPVLVADYLMIHLALFGVVQIALSGGMRALRERLSPLAMVALVIWGVGVFGLALDRYAAGFLPTAERLSIIAVLALGTVPFMIGDALVTDAGRGRLWRRIAARVMLIVSLGIATMLRPEDLGFVLMILPVLVLFFLVHGLMGRWIARTAGPVSAGVGLGLCLAWALGVSFPLFSAA